jgi:hypothetical protein
MTNSKINFGKSSKSEPRDYVYQPTVKNKVQSTVSTAKSLPDYFNRGLKGDPDSNFYEFIKMSKLPYLLGGPGLVATIMAGSNLFDIKANKAAKFNGKGMALGCAGYYLMSAIAKACIDKPLKMARGLDLNHPINTVSFNRPHDKEGHSTFKDEKHSLFESSKFIRWGFVSPDEPDFNYKEIQRKMGIPEDANNPDAMMRPIISSTIKRANSWKYLTSAFAVMLGVGLGNQKALKEDFMTGIVSSIKNTKKVSVKNIANGFKTKVAQPIKNSFVSLWKGSETLGSKVTGKVAILGFLASVAAANVSILSNSKVKQDKEAK